MKIITLSIPFLFGLIFSIEPSVHPILFSSILISFVGYATYKVRFKTFNTFKFFLFRNYLKVKSFVSKINNQSYSEKNTEILPIQNKSIRLWKLLLRDELSQISCSLGNRIRQIEKDNMLLILSPMNQVEYQLTIMDVDSTKSCFYEIPIGSKLSETIIELFDVENERRMSIGQNEKKLSIHNDLDKLILQQEVSLKRK